MDRRAQRQTRARCIGNLISFVTVYTLGQLALAPVFFAKLV